jgi:hypothetical protein
MLTLTLLMSPRISLHLAASEAYSIGTGRDHIRGFQMHE